MMMMLSLYGGCGENVHTCEGPGARVGMWRSKDDLAESVTFFNPYRGPRGQTEVSRLGQHRHLPAAPSPGTQLVFVSLLSQFSLSPGPIILV